jgi:hypothetical protein
MTGFYRHSTNGQTYMVIGLATNKKKGRVKDETHVVYQRTGYKELYTREISDFQAVFTIITGVEQPRPSTDIEDPVKTVNEIQLVKLKTPKRRR